MGKIAMMNVASRLTMTLFPDILAVCRLDPDVAVPPWAFAGPFTSVTRTPAELSIVCLQKGVPEDVRCERGWRYLAVEGPLACALTGILASLTGALALAGVSVFAISTFDTDYLLVREADAERAVELLSREGHRVLKHGVGRTE
ncbi:MAG TPA: ACT domain-containing protein [Syntrophobacteria bacterium]|nr:ACT domain-containing protein [Syntrophobacteria bacterium]